MRARVFLACPRFYKLNSIVENVRSCISHVFFIYVAYCFTTSLSKTQLFPLAISYASNVCQKFNFLFATSNLCAKFNFFVFITLIFFFKMPDLSLWNLSKILSVQNMLNLDLIYFNRKNFV